ncbi:MAG: methyltransferase [Pseudomonadota bacterium]
MTTDNDAGNDLDLDALGALYDKARALEDAGRWPEAAAAFRACLALDPDDHCGVALRLAAHGDAAPTAAPPAYVATLFDQQAEAFDDILVGQLFYDVPALARQMVGRFGKEPFRILDLGCGTGLCGAAFRDIAKEIVGVDLAADMLSLADERGVYDDLYVGEAIAFLAGWDEDPFDLVVAADVLPYLGPLDGFAKGAANALAPGGLIVASTERLEAGEWRVLPSHRFAHSSDYAVTALKAARLELLALEPITVRHEEGAPVPGDLILAQRAGA